MELFEIGDEHEDEAEESKCFPNCCCYISWLKRWSFDCFGACSEEGGIEDYVTPANQEIVTYCKTLVNCKFQGETSNKHDNYTDTSEDEHLVNLGTVLQSMDLFLRERKLSFLGDELEYLELLNTAVSKRCKLTQEIEELREKFLRDNRMFAKIYKDRNIGRYGGECCFFPAHSISINSSKHTQKRW